MDVTAYLLTAALVLAVPASATGQATYVANRTNHTLYATSSAYENRQVPPGGLLPAGTGERVVGFAYVLGSFQLPTFELTVEQEQSAGEFVSVRASDLLAEKTVELSSVGDEVSGPRIDNRYLDWVSVAPVIARARGRRPLASFSDDGGGRQELPVAESLLWERAGTDLEWLKSAPGGSDLFLAASAYSAFSRSSRVLLFIYENSDSYPRATLEIETGTAQSLALLWAPVFPEPAVVGNVVASEFFVEAQLWLDVIELHIGPIGADAVVEIAAASSAAGVWEEFVLARVLLGEFLER